MKHLQQGKIQFTTCFDKGKSDMSMTCPLRQAEKGMLKNYAVPYEETKVVKNNLYNPQKSNYSWERENL